MKRLLAFLILVHILLAAGLVTGHVVTRGARADCTGCALTNPTSAITFTPATSIVLTIKPDGALVRGTKRIEDLSKDELIVLVRELVDSIRKGK